MRARNEQLYSWLQDVLNSKHFTSYEHFTNLRMRIFSALYQFPNHVRNLQGQLGLDILKAQHRRARVQLKKSVSQKSIAVGEYVETSLGRKAIPQQSLQLSSPAAIKNSLMEIRPIEFLAELLR